MLPAINRIILIPSILMGLSSSLTGQAEVHYEEILEYYSNFLEEDQLSLIMEVIDELRENPININLIDPGEFKTSLLFTAFQLYNMEQYRLKYGDFLTVYELAAIPGFNIDMLRLVAPLLSTTYRIEPKVKRIKQQLLSELSFKNPVGVNYFDSSSTQYYHGSPIKWIHRYTAKAGNKYSLGFCTEKDPGERYLYKGKPEHLTTYFEYRPGKGIQKIIIGNYRLHRGLGLVHGFGFSSKSSGINLKGFDLASAKGFASTMEYDYSRGIYVMGRKGNWKMDAYLSHLPADLSFSDTEPGQELFDLVRKSSYHRTLNEVKGQGLGKSLGTGFSINRQSKNTVAGLAFDIERLCLTEKARDSMPGLKTNSTRDFLEIYGLAFGKNFEIYGDIAIQAFSIPGLSCGINVEVNPAIQMKASFRYFADNFNSPSPSIYSGGGNMEASFGGHYRLSITPFQDTRLILAWDIKNELLEERSKRSMQLYNFAEFSWKASEGLNLLIRLTMNTNPDSENSRIHIHNISDGRNSRYRIQLRYELENFRFTNRIEAGMKHLEGKILASSLMYQELKWNLSNKFSLLYRYLIFNVPDWDLRLYSYEPGLSYSFNFQAWSGQGTNTVFLASWKPLSNITLRSKFAFSKYAYTHDSFYSGKSIPNSRKSELAFQLQYRFK